MPGKVNPVIPEFVISAAHKVYSNDNLITNLCAQGCLELNAYLPVIGYCLIDSLKLLNACNTTLNKNLFDGIIINTETSIKRLYSSPSITTALVPYIGYEKCAEIAKKMESMDIDIFKANNILNIIDNKELEIILKPENLLKLGYSINDILKK